MQSLIDIFKNHWKAIAITFTIGKFLWESYINNNQLNKIENEIVLHQKSYGDNINLLVNDKYEQSLLNLKNLVKLTLNKLSFNLIKDLLIIYFDVYNVIWVLSKKINEHLSFILPINSICQTIIFTIISNILIFCWGIPIQFYGEFIVSDFPKREKPINWLMIQYSILIFKILGDSIKILGSLIIIKFIKNFPIWQISLGYFIYSITRISLAPIYINLTAGPNFLKPIPNGELKDEILNLCSKIGFDSNSIYLTDFEFSSMGFNYLPNMITINERTRSIFTIKELSSIILQCILQIKLNLHLQKQIINSIILYINLFFFEKILFKDNNVINQFGFKIDKNQSNNLIFIKYLIFNKIFIPINIIIGLIKNYLNKRKIYQIDQSTFEIYKIEFLNSMIKMKNNNTLKNFENDSIYNLYYSEIPSFNKRIEFLKENNKIE
ncbi:uncharacterized protein KGF55_001456 [Candida pseudojiufengensis]|uniref:uncharacterized protein n=1 Tax=Candida pseudojiufengensis TaxID=497109 RepID=UPI002225456D|nr:uncharacterized protein KGF55_001456 [Candida pseudojiufengensis]KAI5965236.1 hypothetical protein KGF55_001456 [Candida pseudojiufengensis]